MSENGPSYDLKWSNLYLRFPSESESDPLLIKSTFKLPSSSGSQIVEQSMLDFLNLNSIKQLKHDKDLNRRFTYLNR